VSLATLATIVFIRMCNRGLAGDLSVVGDFAIVVGSGADASRVSAISGTLPFGQATKGNVNEKFADYKRHGLSVISLSARLLFLRAVGREGWRVRC
jgi:hypothetical protein